MRPGMGGKAKAKGPDIIRDGKPAAVILDINEYEDLLERLEDAEDLKALEEMKKRPLKFRPFEDFLGEHNSERVDPGDGVEKG